jgi:hypothetical protein
MEDLNTQVRSYYLSLRLCWGVYDAICKTAKKFDMTNDQVKGIIHYSG